MVSQTVAILDPFLRKVERLPDDILRYIHSYLDLGTRVEMICYQVFPHEDSMGINMMELRLNLFNFYELNYFYKLPVKGRMVSLLDILLEIRYCDLLKFYRYFQNICDPKTIFPPSTHIHMVRGDGILKTVVHPIANMVLHAEKTTCKNLHSRYISNIVHKENMKPNFSTKEIVTFKERYSIGRSKQIRSLYISDHLTRVKEIMFLLLIFIRNCQKIQSFVSQIDEALRKHLYIFLRDFLNSEIVSKAIARIYHRQSIRQLHNMFHSTETTQQKYPRC